MNGDGQQVPGIQLVIAKIDEELVEWVRPRPWGKGEVPDHALGVNQGHGGLASHGKASQEHET